MTKHYTIEFRQSVLDKMHEEGWSKYRAAKHFGINKRSVLRWSKCIYKKEIPHAFKPGYKPKQTLPVGYIRAKRGTMYIKLRNGSWSNLYVNWWEENIGHLKKDEFVINFTEDTFRLSLETLCKVNRAELIAINRIKSKDLNCKINKAIVYLAKIECAEIALRRKLNINPPRLYKKRKKRK